MSRTFSRVATISVLAMGLGGVGAGTAFAADAPAPNAGMQQAAQSNVTLQEANANAFALQIAPVNAQNNICVVAICKQGGAQANNNVAVANAQNFNFNQQKLVQKQMQFNVYKKYVWSR